MAQLRQAVRFQLRGRLLKQPTVVPLGERSKLLASLDSGNTVLAAYGNPPDHAEWLVWRKFIRPGDLFVDVGSNVGIYSILAAEMGAKVISVEPAPRAVARLKQNMELNGYDHEIWEVALTDAPKTLHFDADLDSQNWFTENGDGTEVRGETFDSLIKGRHVRGLKIDVEGAERWVLLGAQAALSEGRIDLIQMEWNGTSSENFGETREPLMRLLEQHGFSLFRPGPTGRLVSTDYRVENAYDVFAARPEVAAACT